jgi:pantetheine-phosphate adenylyltransferase
MKHPHAIMALMENALPNAVQRRTQRRTRPLGGSQRYPRTMTIAVCPGSYDPVTAGHLDVIERSARFFDEVHVVVAVNAAKTPMFMDATRVDSIRRALDEDGYSQVKVASTSGLITDYCQQVGASVIVKGLRQNGDYEAELGMALVNRKLAHIETLFLPADPVLEHISSSIVKDVARHGGDVTGMVPDCVVPLLADALKEEGSR